LTLSDDSSISKYLEQLDKESRAIKKEILELCWYMRGGLTYDDAMLLGPSDRSIILEITNQHLEVTKTSKLPFF
jgi:hypothetical protein